MQIAIGTVYNLQLEWKTICMCNGVGRRGKVGMWLGREFSFIAWSLQAILEKDGGAKRGELKKMNGNVMVF